MPFSSSGRRDWRCRAGDRRWDMEDRGGFEFLCEALIQSIVERVARMGGGRSEGANPRNPIRHELCGLRSVLCERVISTVPRNQFAKKPGTPSLIEEWWGDYQFSLSGRTEI